MREKYGELYVRFPQEPSPTATSASSSPAIESPAASPTISSSTSSPTETPASSVQTEEEQKIREMLAYYANVWSKGDMARII
jgi:hypothetical protein